MTTTLTRPLVQEKPAPVHRPELGGSLQVGPRPGDGTLVIANYPAYPVHPVKIKFVIQDTKGERFDPPDDRR